MGTVLKIIIINIIIIIIFNYNATPYVGLEPNKIYWIKLAHHTPLQATSTSAPGRLGLYLVFQISVPSYTGVLCNVSKYVPVFQAGKLSKLRKWKMPVQMIDALVDAVNDFNVIRGIQISRIDFL